MAATSRAAKRCLRISSKATPTLCRSIFQARREDTKNPNWISVGLSLSSAVLLWTMLIRHHNYELAEYEKRKTEQGG